MITLHELGHSLSIGEIDDNRSRRLPFSEVYSGSLQDDTVGQVEIRSDTESVWRIMRAGWGDQSLIYHQNTGYHVYSIEELLSAQQMEE
jgi:hypothetical protein